MMIQLEGGFRSLKVASVLKRALSQVFMRGFYDLSAFVSVSEVKVSDDVRNATVFVIVCEGEFSKNEVVAILNEASADIRRSAFRYLSLRYVPRLYFKLDTGFDNFLCVSETISELEK